MVSQQEYTVIEPPTGGEVESKAIMCHIGADVLDLVVRDETVEPPEEMPVTLKVWNIIQTAGDGIVITGNGLEESLANRSRYVIRADAADTASPARMIVTRP